MRKPVAVVVAAAVSGCSFIATTPLPRGHQVQSGVLPSCSQSNFAAGVDLVLATTAVVVSLVAADEAGDPTVSDKDKEGAVPAAIVAGGVALLLGYSTVRGFQRTGACRDAAEAAGYESHGAKDWAIPPLIILTAGAAAVLVLRRSAPTYEDPDLCAPGATRTALCADGVYSCSLNRAGTCSHHHGVVQPLWP